MSATFKILPGIWHRNDATNDSVLETGLANLDIADSEKLVTRFVAVASSQSANSTLQVFFKSGVNPGGPVFGQSAKIIAP